MAGWHHQLNGNESGQTLGNSEGQGSLACCGSWDREAWCALVHRVAMDTTEQLN